MGSLQNNYCLLPVTSAALQNTSFLKDTINSYMYVHEYRLLIASCFSIFYKMKFGILALCLEGLKIALSRNENPNCFIMLYKVVITFESVDEILKCDHSNKSY